MEQDSLFQIKEDIRPLADRMRPENIILKEYFIKRNLIVWYEDLVKHWSLKTKKLFIGG